MRRFLWLTALVCCLGMTKQVHAQALGPWGSLFTYPTSNQPFSTTNPNMPIAGSMSVNNKFPSSSSFFPSIGTLNTQHVYGTSSFPTQNQMDAATGSYLAAFQYRRPGRWNPFGWLWPW